MKQTKFRLLFAMTMLFVCTIYAQEEKSYQMYSVHEDQVKPSKVMAYEKTAKAFATKMREHNVKSGGFLVASSDDFRYMYINPIENMGDLDENPGLDELRKAMGDDEFGKLMSGYSPCYDRHGSYVISMDKELTYMPSGITQTPEDENYRKFYYIYYSPKNAKSIKEAMKGVKDLFVKKNSQNYYRVYHSAFGSMDAYYMVAVAAKDPIEMAQNSATNDKLLGEEAQPVFSKVLSYALKMEEITGHIRPDLSYNPNKMKEN